jgi:ferritin-like metal-binding protein YciE
MVPVAPTIDAALFSGLQPRQGKCKSTLEPRLGLKNQPTEPSTTATNKGREDKMERIDSLEALLLHELKDLYNAEKQLTRALPKVAKKASSPQLKAAIEKHLEETEGQVERLEKIFNLLGETPKGTKCKGMEGILEEGQELMKQEGTPEALDSAIIMSAQKVEHYEIAAYGSLATFADMLRRRDIKTLLGQTLEEEKKTDKLLTELATSGINQESAEETRKAA